MTTKELLTILEGRKLRIEVRADGPHLIGPKLAMTPKLLRVIRLHRAEILRTPEVARP